MTRAVLDDHLLRDLLADDVGDDLAELLSRHEPATTNLYYVRLCRSVVAAPGGRLTGSWPIERRRALGRVLVELPQTVEIVPLRSLAYSMAELADGYGVSMLGAEAVASAQHLAAPLCVWGGDDGPRIRAAAGGTGTDYRTVAR